MPAIGTLILFTPVTTILSDDVNSNFATIQTAVNTYCVFKDVATTITAAHTFSGLQTFTAGLTLSGSSNLQVAGTSTLTGAVSAPAGVTGNLTGNVTGNLTGNVTGGVTGNASTATALATARNITLTGDVTGTASFDGTATASITAAIGTGVIVNADVNASAAIAYSKLALTGAILNADLAGSIAYGKLSLTGAILNADIAASAGISSSKLATVLPAQGGTGVTTTPGSGYLLIGNAGGTYTVNQLTAGTDIGISVASGSITINYTGLGGGGGGVSDGDKGDIVVSSSGTVWSIDTGVITNAMVNASAAIAYSKLALTGTIVNADISASAAIAYSKLNLTGAVTNGDLAGSISNAKLDTITTAGKVANSATTAVKGNTANAIVTRGASGEFTAGTVTVDAVKVGVNQVVGARITGWALDFTGTTADRTVTLREGFVNGAVSLADAAANNDVILLYRAFKALHDDLTSHGIIGA